LGNDIFDIIIDFDDLSLVGGATRGHSRWLAFSSGVEPASGGAVKLWIKNAIF
jgi:hypothetical protein